MERTYAIAIAVLAVIIAVYYYRRSTAPAAAPAAKSYTVSGLNGLATNGVYKVVPTVTGSAYNAPLFLYNLTGDATYPFYYLAIRRADNSYVGKIADVPAALAAAGTMVNAVGGLAVGQQGWNWQLVSTLKMTPNY